MCKFNRNDVVYFPALGNKSGIFCVTRCVPMREETIVFLIDKRGVRCQGSEDALELLDIEWDGVGTEDIA